MLMPMIALVIILSGQGKAINTDLRFSDMAECEAAAAKILAVRSELTFTACVEVK